MLMPHGERAVVARQKVTEYLLSWDHPVGQHKSRFLVALGFRPTEPEVLIERLLEIARLGELVDAVDSAFGRRYVVDGTLRGSKLEAIVRTVWLVAPGDAEPQFVTAYPGPGGAEEVHGDS